MSIVGMRARLHGATNSNVKSGYTECACPDCMEIAVSNDMAHPDMCSDCKDAGCTGEGECWCTEAYESVDRDEP